MSAKNTDTDHGVGSTRPSDVILVEDLAMRIAQLERDAGENQSATSRFLRRYAPILAFITALIVLPQEGWDLYQVIRLQYERPTIELIPGPKLQVSYNADTRTAGFRFNILVSNKGSVSDALRRVDAWIDLDGGEDRDISLGSLDIKCHRDGGTQIAFPVSSPPGSDLSVECDILGNLGKESAEKYLRAGPKRLWFQLEGKGTYPLERCYYLSDQMITDFLQWEENVAKTEDFDEVDCVTLKSLFNGGGAS